MSLQCIFLVTWEVGGARSIIAAALLFGLFHSPAIADPKPSQYQYLSPLPGAQYVLPENNIIIRYGDPIDPHSILPNALRVVGSESGKHSGELILTEGERTVLFIPDVPFTHGETVEVTLKRRFKTLGRANVPSLRFQFHVATHNPQVQRTRSSDPVLDHLLARGASRQSYVPSPLPARTTGISSPCEALPSHFPEFEIVESNNPDPGHVFFGLVGRGADARFVIIDNYGLPIFYSRYPNSAPALDFKLQSTGYLSGLGFGPGGFAVLDSSYNVVNKYSTGNGWRLDGHDFLMMENGHVLVMGNIEQAIPMDEVLPGGRPDAVVLGNVIQELDADKNVIFQWRTWDHYDILDVNSELVAPTDPFIDYAHGNAFEIDYDGHILFSVRHMNEITKINRQTGEIIWRMGSHAKNNEFTFVNDPRGFSHLHDVRRLPNGHLTVYDNGNFLEPQYSRALEYEVDEVNKVATLVWEYRNTPDVFGGFFGNLQKRVSGGAMISWGGTIVGPRVTDVHPDGSKAFELEFPPANWTYRAFRFPWRTNRFVAEPASLDFGFVAVGDSDTQSLTVRNDSDRDVIISCFITTDSAISIEAAVPFTLPPGAEETVQVKFAPSSNGEYVGNLHVRQVQENEIVAQVVSFSGTSGTVGVSDVVAGTGLVLKTIGPNPFRAKTSIQFYLPQKGRVTLEIFNVLGRRVDSLVNEIRSPGQYQESWTPNALAGGLYFVLLRQGDQIKRQKILLLE